MEWHLGLPYRRRADLWSRRSHELPFIFRMGGTLCRRPPLSSLVMVCFYATSHNWPVGRLDRILASSVSLLHSARESRPPSPSYPAVSLHASNSGLWWRAWGSQPPLVDGPMSSLLWQMKPAPPCGEEPGISNLLGPI